MGKMSILIELGQFLKVNKKLWLLPMILVLLLLAAVFAIGQYSAVAPFIYTLF
jgi:hypothetical protein